MQNLLRDPLIILQDRARTTRQVDLPTLLSMLTQDDVETFPKVRPHQEHALHAFLVQVAVMALVEYGWSGAPPHDVEEWRQLLVGLAPGEEHLWDLIGDDDSLPALLQPTSDVDWEANADRVFDTPDGFEILVTAKNFDVKQRVQRMADVEHWFYTLLTLQTCGGFSGAKNYGILRMNKGLGNRASFATYSSLRPGVRFCEDVEALVACRDDVINVAGFKPQGGIKLSWSTAWDGESGVTPDELDPYFIETCRRARIKVNEDGKIVGLMLTSSAAHVSTPKDFKLSGDPWTPVDVGDAKPITLARNSFSTKLITDLLFTNRYRTPPCMMGGPDKVFLVISALVRGQGKTEGYREIVIRISPEVRRSLSNPDVREDAKRVLGLISESQHEDVEDARRTLKTSARYVMGLEPIGKDVTALDVFMKDFSRRVEAAFFEHLWTRYEAGDDESHQKGWRDDLVEITKDVYADVRRQLVTTRDKYAALARADRSFNNLQSRVYR